MAAPAAETLRAIPFDPTFRFWNYRPLPATRTHDRDASGTSSSVDRMQATVMALAGDELDDTVARAFDELRGEGDFDKVQAGRAVLLTHLVGIAETEHDEVGRIVRSLIDGSVSETDRDGMLNYATNPDPRENKKFSVANALWRDMADSDGLLGGGYYASTLRLHLAVVHPDQRSVDEYTENVLTALRHSWAVAVGLPISGFDGVRIEDFSLVPSHPIPLCG